MVDITKTSSLTTLGTTTGTKAQSGAAPATDKPGKDAGDPEELKSQFLNILLTQMQNQNPLDPMDTKELTGQLAQFSSLEQQINTNSKLDGMLTAIKSSASTSAFNYIGQTAELNSKMSVVEDGAVDWNYTVNTPADTLTVKVKDQSGKVLYTKDMKNVASGTYAMNVNADDFETKPTDGQVLTLEVTGKDASGTAIASNISTTVRVDGVESGADGIDLRSGGLLFSLDDVMRFKTVSKPTTTTPATPAAAA